MKFPSLDPNDRERSAALASSVTALAVVHVLLGLLMLID